MPVFALNSGRMWPNRPEVLRRRRGGDGDRFLLRRRRNWRGGERAADDEKREWLSSHDFDSCDISRLSIARSPAT